LSIFNELKRRNVFRVVFGYIVSSWLLVQVADLVLENIGSPDWVIQTIMLVIALGFPVVVFFSWAYEVTPEGIKHESEVDRSQSIMHRTGRKLDRAITAVLIVALAYFAYDKFVLSAERDADLVEATTQAVTEQAETEQEESAEPDKSIAVLPFVNMSSDPEQEYFSDGISEELLNLLTKIPGLRVIARTSSFSFKGQDVSVAEIAETLNVAHVLEGSVRKSGNQVRITAQLIRVRDSSHLWSVSYDRELDNIFVIQDEIAALVVKKLKVTLLEPAPIIAETDPAAYDLFLKARQLGREFTPEALQQALVLYKQVLEIDSEYAEAWIDIAYFYYLGETTGVLVLDNSFTLAREAAESALTINPDLADAHAVLSFIELVKNRDLKAAVRHFILAAELEPNNLAIFNNGELLFALNRLPEWVAIMKLRVSRDPLSEWNHLLLGDAYRAVGRFNEALLSLRTAQNLVPQMPFASSTIGQVLLLGGKPGAALLEFNQEQVEWPRLTGQAMAHFALGQLAQSDTALAELIERYEKDSAIQIAQVLAYRNEVDRAFKWLDKAVQNNDAGLTAINHLSFFENLHGDSRWLEIQRRIGVAPEQIHAIELVYSLPQ
jgi:adenylate cyclase